MPCCLCSNPEAPHAERRRSGDNDALESWRFCPECWRELQRQLTDHDPIICERYKIFLQFISGHYRMQRAFNGNRASGIRAGQGEKNMVDKHISIKVSFAHAKELHTINRNGAFDADEATGNPGRPGCEHDNRIALPAIPGEGREARYESQTEEINCLEADPPGGETPDGP
jgi:hypothetical protein